MKKILIIEDDEKVAKALGIRIRSAGYDTTIAGDAVSGVSTALKLKPDLVMLDINMPAGNGFTVAERIQSLIPGRTPIVFITASKLPGLAERAVEMGASGFIEKPYHPEQVITLLNNILSKASLGSQSQPVV